MNSPDHFDRLFHWAALGAWLVFLLAMLGNIAHANSPTGTLEDPQRIIEAATRHARAEAGSGRIQAQARLPDTRLRLQRCSEELHASGRQFGQRLQVMVSCPGSWKIYVPVSLRQEKELVVAKRSLQTDEVITSADLSLEWKAIKGTGYGHFESPDGLIGRRVARPIKAGQIITPGQLRQAWSIRKGDIVTLVSRAGAIEIRSRGRAEQDALENTRLKVRNLSSGRIVEGYARTNGIVEIQG